MKVINADLHIHTCLSPCADFDMTPIKIVNQAVKKNITIIAICDHNSAENVSAVMKASMRKKLKVIAGIEISTAEEIHILGLFDDASLALSMQELVYDNLCPGENDEETFGLQIIANEYDEVEGINNRLLIGSTKLTISQVVDAIHERRGLAIASHIDREAFSVLGQIGFIPQDLPLDGLEIATMPLYKAHQKFPAYSCYPFLSSSDAHCLDDIGRRITCLHVNKYCLSEIKMDLKKSNSRSLRQETD